jgi:hypothetical protein
MAAIISDKFRIFNATQFLESLTEGTTDVGEDRTRMYFFVGRPQRWDAYLEIYNKSSINFAVGEEVYVGASYAAATFKATVRQVYEDSLLLYGVLPTVLSSPATGSTLTGNTSGATALTGVYRYSTEDVPPVPLDNQSEKYDIYDDIIAAKRVTSSYARNVIRRYDWDLVANPKFDMWKPDYSSTPGGGGQIGKSSATGATSIVDSKFYVINSNYEVFKCLYNGQTPANPTGVNATYQPRVSPVAGQGTYVNGIYSEPSNTYIWKYLYTIPTDDVLRFMSTGFIPIVEKTNSTRIATETAVVNGAVHVVLIENNGINLPTGTHYAPIIGDGTGGKVEIVVSGGGSITSVTVNSIGSNYSYATVALKTGTGSGASAYGLFSDVALTSPRTVPANATGALEAIISPQGGHGFNLEEELNGKRVMLNVRLTYSEGFGDFPVDNDFRRIGIITNPILNGTTDYATVDTLSGLYAVKINGATAGFTPDDLISQTVTGGTAFGTVVSWTLDSGSTTSGILKYIQSPQFHKDDKGVVRLFESNGANAITAITPGGSLGSGTVDTAFADGTTVLGSTFVDGIALPEIKNNSGEVIYIENRRLITRAPDQIEDIKLVIEF